MSDEVNVYGNIYDSDIHHNHFGVYTYGHQQGDWRRNKMHDNTAYGFDPHDDSDFLTIHDNEVYNNGNHGIIASKRCNGVSIQVVTCEINAFCSFGVYRAVIPVLSIGFSCTISDLFAWPTSTTS